MAGIASQKFSGWLNEKLRELNTDESVFGSYILGILEDDDGADEKREALQDIISQIVEVNPYANCSICPFIAVMFVLMMIRTRMTLKRLSKRYLGNGDRHGQPKPKQ